MGWCSPKAARLESAEAGIDVEELKDSSRRPLSAEI